MTSLRQLTLPPVSGTDDASLVWDETIGSSKNDTEASLTARPWEHPSLCSHAIAHESLVCGIGPSPMGSRSTDWITWKTSFAPQKVCRVACNDDGSIVVASTNAGNVSLLSGKDGKVLATRNVITSSSSSEGLAAHACRPAEVAFVSNARCHQAKDVLIILVPTSDQLSANDDDAQATQENVNVILVSNIDGKRLNDDDHPEQIVEAAKAMSIDVLNLDANSRDFEALQGCFIDNASTIRFAVGEADGNVSIHDYNVETKRSVVVCKKIHDDTEAESSLSFVTTLGMRLQHCASGGATFLLLCGHDSDTAACTKLYWYDLAHLNMACAYILAAQSPLALHSVKKPWLLALEPVTSFSDDSALAVAVALKDSSTAQNGCVKVIQVIVEETLGLAVLSHPHKVFQVPLIRTHDGDAKSPLRGVSLNALDCAEPYSFRFQTCFGSSDLVQCHEFLTSDATLVGKVRMLLQRELYDEADEILAANDCTIVSADPFALFHTSEVALRKLQRLLSKGNLASDDHMERAEECLRRLVAGAVSGSDLGQHHLLEAADSVVAWPKDVPSRQKPTIAVFSVALSAMIAAIDTALKSAHPVLGPKLEGKKKELADRLSTMKCLEDLVDTDSSEIVLDPLFLDSKSPCDVFLILMEEGLFSMAEKLWRSEWGRQLTAETSATAILSLSPSQDPRAYGSVIKNFVFPRLSISHEAIPLIRAWACNCANAYDENDNGLGLEASTFLLEIVLAGIRQLNARVHSSYANYSPFVETKPKKQRVSPRNGKLDNTISSFSSEGSTSSQPTRANAPSTSLSINPIPTVLELGHLKGGAMKTKLGPVASRRSGDAASFMDDEVDDREESVEIKLTQARLLWKARELGLPHEVVSLREYSRLGGSQRVAKELVRIHSSSASGHDERYLGLTSKVKPFCDEAGVDYDQILVSFNADLCDSKHTSAQTLLESSSVARCCFAPLVKCQVALTVLRVALLCGKALPCLTQLSKNAIEWASVDEAVRSELEEATRLLVVDGIVRKYCGAGARELFRVDNPLHVVRLLNFVSRHFREKSVLSDVLDLCDAFTFLAREDACVLVLQRAAASGDAYLCIELLEAVFSLGDLANADVVSLRIIKYCCHELEDMCSMVASGPADFHRESFKDKAVSICKVGRAIVEACRDRFYGTGESFPLLQASFAALVRLQEHHQLFLPLSVFGSKSETMVASRRLVTPVVEAFCAGNMEAGQSLLKRVRATCTILANPSGLDSQALWYSIAGAAASCLASTTHDGGCIDFLGAAGILNDNAEDFAVRAMLSVALKLCRSASDEAGDIDHAGATLRPMENIVRASSLVHDYCLIRCPERILKVLVPLGHLTETAKLVALSADEGLGETLEILCEKLSEDARSRRNSFTTQPLLKRTGVDPLRVRKRLLHPSWYVGDGLLLSPREALCRSVAFCRDVLDICRVTGSSEYTTEGIVAIHRFLGDRGAHATALRITSVYASMALSADRLPYSLNGGFDDGFVVHQRDSANSLAERSLGGGGSGITSMTIDSQLAVSFLLALPLKAAFKVYRAALPAAITKRDFSRVITLSNVGVKTGDGEVGWHQPVFLSQCRALSSHAFWWKILTEYQVEFDPSRFDDDGQLQAEEDTTGTSTSAYVATLVPELICKASLVHRSTDSVRSLAIKFVRSFGLEPAIAAQKHIEHVLSPPPLDRSHSDASIPPERVCDAADHSYGCPDIRLNVALCERAAGDSLRLISSPMERLAVLRRCLANLESSHECDKDYERHAMLLSLYHDGLPCVVAKDLNIRDLDASAFEEELEFIERRRDALEILSSYFQGEQKVHRPPFPKFFVPLSVAFSAEREKSHIRPCDFLGISLEQHQGLFDPLAPLQDFVTLYMDEAAAKALAPLTIPLGLPDGSVHVRWLIERCRKSREGGATLPSFEKDVLPVLKRLKQSTDQSRLAEWCATNYDDLDSQKLQCLDYGLRSAMIASSEVEKRIRVKSKGEHDDLAMDERLALDAVKRLSEMHSALSDRLEVNGILRSAIVGTTPSQFGSVEKTVRDLTDRLQETFWKSSDSSPEKFVELLLVEASLLASSACLEEDVSFSIGQFRRMASVVHQACKKISDQYSHVHPGDVSRYLARRWLIHGDEISKRGDDSAKSHVSEEKKVGRLARDLSVSAGGDEDATADFVMDLNDANSVWSDDIGSSLLKSDQPTTISREEEPLALKDHGSSREASELECTNASLRVAFVMSFAEGYHKSHNDETSDEENIGSRLNSKQQREAGARKKRRGLLSRISTSELGTRSSVPVMEHARELLRIVFAKSGGSGTDLTDSFVSSNALSTDQTTRKTLTFAMRYRAFRTAAILCPQAALEKIVAEEGYLNGSLVASECSLSKCSYGAFVAKEIEEMGLPLPHSDLLVLSTMNFPSYARALWRHHRDGEVRGQKGRLLLLLLEMSLRDNSVNDHSATLLDEMTKLQLPRTLLLGCECIAKCKENTTTSESPFLSLDEGGAVFNAVFATTNLVLSEFHRSLSSPTSKLQNLAEGLPTIRRVGTLVEVFSYGETGQRQIVHFVKVLCDLIALGNKAISNHLVEIALSAARRIQSVERRKEAFGLLRQQGIDREFATSATPEVTGHGDKNSSTLSTLMFEAESLYSPSVLATKDKVGSR